MRRLSLIPELDFRLFFKAPQDSAFRTPFQVSRRSRSMSGPLAALLHPLRWASGPPLETYPPSGEAWIKLASTVNRRLTARYAAKPHSFQVSINKFPNASTMPSAPGGTNVVAEYSLTIAGPTKRIPADKLSRRKTAVFSFFPPK